MAIVSCRAAILMLIFAGGVAPPLASAQAVFLPPDTAASSLLSFQPTGQDDAFDGLLLQAQDYEDDGKTPKKGKNKSRSATSLNSGTTKAIVVIIKHANDTCDTRILRRYRIDCLRIYYGWVADELPNTGDYVAIKQAMRTAEKKLSAIVSANVDNSQPVITPREGHKKSAKKLPPLRAVKPAAERKAIAQAEAVIKETEIAILRSGEDPARRTAHFQDVAEAVDSNLVVLRSA